LSKAGSKLKAGYPAASATLLEKALFRQANALHRARWGSRWCLVSSWRASSCFA